MTKRKGLKQIVRERMAQTGETYQQALAAVLAMRPKPAGGETNR